MQQKNTKCVEFDTNIGDFNVFIKYSTTPQDGWDRKKRTKIKRKYWNISFSPEEYSYLCNSFEKLNKNNLVAIVCANQKITDTRIAILTLDQAKECLSKHTGGIRRITVSRTGNEHNFDCFGVGSSHEKTNIHPYVNHMRFFDDVIDDNQ